MSYLQVVLGLGVVIFVHELGHFLLAKWNGVKVEKFSIGFGTPIVAWRRGVGFRFFSSIPIPEPPTLGPEEASTQPAPLVGETEYAIAIIPLGGFVKMLGESMEDEASHTTDPRAYPNKSVGARMAIISAGVIMNVIFALVTFVFVYRNGVKEVPSLIGSVEPGSPAYVAGIRPGDEVLAIDNKRPVTFQDLRFRSALSGEGQALRMEVATPGEANPRVHMVEPRSDPSSAMPRMGLGPSAGTTLVEPPYEAPPGVLHGPGPKEVSLRAKDRVVAIGPADGASEPVIVPLDVDRLLTKYRNVAIRVEVERTGQAAKEGTNQTPATRVSAELPVNPVLDFGLRMGLGPIDAVAKDSLADRAGFRAGDLIVEVDGRADLDPIRLPIEVYDQAGREMKFVVRRSLPGNAKGQLVTITVVPEAAPTFMGRPLSANAPVDVPALGLCYRVEPGVAAVAPGSPAAEAGVSAGAIIRGARLTAKTKDGKPPKRRDIKNIEFDGKAASSWAYFFALVQAMPHAKIELLIGDAKAAVTLTPRPRDDWHNPERGLELGTLVRDLPPQGALAAMRRGLDDVTDNALSVFMMLRGVVQRRLGREVISGPIGIFRMGSEVARASTIEFFRFLAQISMSLAVINFLPIPPLDGGQMVFLLAEKVRGRPLPESALAPVTWAGLIMLLALMALVMFQDLWHLIDEVLGNFI